MKVLLINGSPNKQGCTYTALSEVAASIEEAGVQTEIVSPITGPIRGCTGCGACSKLKRCVFADDVVNSMIDAMETADGLIVGSPVYFASPNGALLSLLDRMFYAGTGRLVYKPGAAVVSARRAGTTAALDVLNKYFLIRNMPVVSSQYWPMVHGNTPEEVLKDEEGLQIMRTLGRNMAWLIKCIAAGDAPPPREPQPKRTNFIR